MVLWLLVLIVLLGAGLWWWSLPPKPLRQFKLVPVHAFYLAQFQNWSCVRLWREYLSPAFQEDKLITIKFPLGWSLMCADYALAKHITLNLEMFPKFLFFKPEGGMAKTLAGGFFGLNVAGSDGADWRRFHRVVSKAFAKIWPTEVIGDVALRAISLITVDKVMDITPWFKKMTFDILAESVLDLRINALEKEEAAPVYGHLHKILKELLKLFWLVVHPLDRPWNPWRTQIFATLGEYHDILDQTVELKKQSLLKEGGDRKDLLSLLIQANEEEEPEHKLTQKEIRDNLTIFFLAGHDTTATALTVALYLLALHPEIQEKARKEVLQVLQPGVIPSHAQLKEMPYVLAVIKEGQRLYPSATVLDFRYTAEDYVFPDGRSVPKDTKIWVSILEINRDPQAWPNPHAFNPDRFLSSSPLSTAQPANYLTFSNGKRICLGMQFSLVEQRVVLSMLLCKYRWRLADPTAKLDFGPSTLLVPTSLEMIFEE